MSADEDQRIGRALPHRIAFVIAFIGDKRRSIRATRHYFPRAVLRLRLASLTMSVVGALVRSRGISSRCTQRHLEISLHGRGFARSEISQWKT